MQPLDNDMDELMRRAAEDYPLNVGGSDWNKVFSKLHEGEKEKKRRFLWFWIYALPGAALLTMATWGIMSRQSSLNKDHIAAGSNNKRQTPHQSVPLAPSQTAQQENANASVASSAKSSSRAASHLSANNDRSLSSHLQGDKGQRQILSTALQRRKHLNKKDRKNVDATGSFTDAALWTGNKASLATAVSASSASVKHLAASMVVPSFSLNHPAAPFMIVSQVEKTTVKKPATAHLYVTMLAGLDQSIIKMQKTSSPGYTAGILASYQFLPRWRIEGGAWWDKKAYYTKGEYFNMKLYSNATIESVEGTCGMVELPLLFQYRLSRNENRFWFATLGVSSYLMKKEDYEYAYTTGSNIPSEGYKTFINSTNNWFSVVHVSGGFTAPVGHLGSLRIEPYLGLPLQGLGIGKLPITSSGINVGITRKLF